MEGVNQFKDLTLVFENSATGYLQVWTDLPGGTMAVRRTLTLPTTTARAERTFPFDDYGQGLIEGRLIKFKALPAGTLKLYAGFVRFRRVGTYIDGTAQEIWETQEISL